MSKKTLVEFWHFSRPGLTDMSAHAAQLEEQGWHGMSLTDSQNLSHDVYVALTLAASSTTRLNIGPGVTNPITRHSAVAAGAIASIQQLSGGRAVFGLGRGDSSLFNIGQKPAPRAIFEPYLASVQSYLRGDTIDFNGYPSCLHWLARSELPKVPVDVAATGPKVIAIAARHAERVSFAVGADPARTKWAIQHLKQSTPAGSQLASAGLYINLCVSNDVDEAVELVRPGVGIFAHFSGMSDTAGEVVSNEDRDVFKAIESGYDQQRHGRADAAHAKSLPVDFIKRFAIIGSPETCVERLRALVDLGIERFYVIGPRPDHFGERAVQATARFARDVLPVFADQ